MTTVAHIEPNRRQHAIPRVTLPLPFEPCTKAEHQPFHQATAAQWVAEGFDPARIEDHARTLGADLGGPGLLRTSMIMRDLYARQR